MPRTALPPLRYRAPRRPAGRRLRAASAGSLASALAVLLLAGTACQGRGPGRADPGASGAKGDPARLTWEYAHVESAPGRLTGLAVLHRGEAWAVGEDFPPTADAPPTAEAAGKGEKPERAERPKQPENAGPTESAGRGEGRPESGSTASYLLRHYGGAWARVPLPEALGARHGQPRIASLGTGGLLLWAGVADTSETLFLRRDGASWQRLPSGPQGPVGDVEVLGPRDVWALERGGHGAWHWNGRSWRRYPLPAVARDLDGTFGQDVWAVGHRDNGPGTGPGAERTQPAVLHFDGNRWALARTPVESFPEPVPTGAAAWLDRVVALAPNRVLAFGRHSFRPGDPGTRPAAETLRLRWDGSAWNRKDAWPGDCANRSPLARDAGRGLFLADGRYLTTEGRCTRIAPGPLPAGIAIPGGEAPGAMRLARVASVPGTREVLAVGSLPPVAASASAGRGEGGGERAPVAVVLRLRRG